MTLVGEFAKGEKNLAWLFEIELTYRIDGKTWTANGSPNTNVYWMDHSSEGSPSRVRAIVKATHVVSSYTQRASIAECQANPSSWFYDSATGRLHVRTSGGDSPASGLYYVASHFWKYYCDDQRADNPIVFNSAWYEPKLIRDSIPDVTLDIGGFMDGGVSESWGSVQLENADGELDSALNSYIWSACRYLVKVGVLGESYSEFKTVIRGRTGSIVWTETSITIGVEDQRRAED